MQRSWFSRLQSKKEQPDGNGLVRLSREKNNALVEQQMKDKPAVVSGMPNVITIEPGAACLLRCLFCPQIDPTFDLSRKFLKTKDFQKIIGRFEGCLQHINLFNWGEPLLNPDLVKMIEYAFRKNISCTVHSNLNTLTPELAKALVLSGLSELTASIDGASEESYSRYRVRGSFSTAIRNLKLLNNAKKELGRSNPRIIWQFLVFRHNENEIDKAKEMAADIGVAIKIGFAVVTDKAYESTREEYNGKNFQKKFIQNYDLPCLALWRNPVIHSDGTVFPCCMIFHKKYAVGNLMKEDFGKIWNNEKYQELRNIVTGRTPSRESFFCHWCMFNPMAGDKKYEEIQTLPK